MRSLELAPGDRELLAWSLVVAISAFDRESRGLTDREIAVVYGLDYRARLVKLHKRIRYS